MADMDRYKSAKGDRAKEGQVKFATGVDYNSFLGSALEDSIAKLSPAPDNQAMDLRTACVSQAH